MNETKKIVVVIPAYKVSKFICKVIEQIGPEVSNIIVVDDCCPENSGEVVSQSFPAQNRIIVIRHPENRGVGGAMVTGYKAALDLDAEIIVKLDGDGQMNPSLIESLVEPIVSQQADYSKGNRFFMIESLKSMPPIRIFGNAALSFVSKFAHGYWNVMDPTNGFVAIHSTVLRCIPLEKIERRYFFENDMLFRLSTLRAVVVDVPMDSSYGEEESNLNIANVVREFPPKFFVRVCKRIGYNYFLRDFTACSLELVIGFCLFVFGVIFGITNWIISAENGDVASAGTVMLAGLPILVGLNLLIAALSYDISNIPVRPLQLILKKRVK